MQIRQQIHTISCILAFAFLSVACQPVPQPSGIVGTSTDQATNHPEAAASPAGSAFSIQATPERATDQDFSIVDRPDDVDGYQIHFIYALPSDGKDDFLDLNGKIALSAAALNYWLESRTEHRLRFDTYQGELDISFLLLDATAAQISDLGADILSLMEREIKTRGFNSDHKLYVVHYDGMFVTREGYCGLAAYPPDGAGITAVLLLRGYNSELQIACPRQFTKSEDFAGYFELTILHELLHLMGMVPECAPNYDDGHVSDSSQDLLYFQYDGSFSPLYTYLDLHSDDYFNHGIPDCPDLARSVFLDPLPANAELPPGWALSLLNVPPDPLATKSQE
jgi:hypothetical protein